MSFAASDKPDWRFSLRLALGVAGLFAATFIAFYFSAGAMQEHALAREETALVLDRREDVRLAWRDSGASGVSELLKEVESSTGEQLAVRVERSDGTLAFEGATTNAPEIPWPSLTPSNDGAAKPISTAKGWTATQMSLPTGDSLRVARYSSVIADVRAAYRSLFATTVCSLLLLGIAGSMVLVILALRPLRQTVAVMRHIVRTGDWAARVKPPKAAGEMRNLAEAFNNMLERQQRLVEGMRQSLDHVAHDLRTPLTRLQVTVESGLEKSEPKSLARDALADCLEEAQRVKATLDTLMDVAEAEAGAMKLRTDNIQVSDLFAEIVDLYEFAAEEKGARIEMHFNAGLTFTGDYVRLRRATANLVDNALKYLGDGHLIELEAERVEGDIVLRVRDDGMGIPPEDLPRIWDRLFRVDRSRSAPGLGLGLSLVKAIADAHNGTAEATSILGKGSTFELRFPDRPRAK